jgi:hypothetical protein
MGRGVMSSRQDGGGALLGLLLVMLALMSMVLA